MHKPARILLLSVAEEAETVDINNRFVARLNEKFADQFVMQTAHYNDVGFVFEAHHPEAFLLADNKLQVPLAQFDLVYIKSYKNFLESANAITECLQAAGVPIVGREPAQTVSLTKLSQYARLVRAGLPVPKAMFMPSPHLANSYELITETFGAPFILKDIDGLAGRSNFLIRDEAHFQTVVRNNPTVSFIAQQFIENSGDLRILVVGYEPRLVISRRRQDDATHLNNTSQGADAQLLELDTLGAETLRIAVDAARLLKREIAGADIMFEEGSGRPFLLEVNAGPQIVSGAYVDEKADIIGRYFTEQVAKN